MMKMKCGYCGEPHPVERVTLDNGRTRMQPVRCPNIGKLNADHDAQARAECAEV